MKTIPSIETIEFLCKNAGKDVKLAEVDKCRLFGIPGHQRNEMIGTYMEYLSRQASGAARQGGAYLYNYRVRKDEVLKLLPRLESKVSSIKAEIVQPALDLMKQGLTFDTAQDIVSGKISLISRETSSLLGRSTNNVERLKLLEQENA